MASSPDVTSGPGFTPKLPYRPLAPRISRWPRAQRLVDTLARRRFRRGLSGADAGDQPVSIQWFEDRLRLAEVLPDATGEGMARSNRELVVNTCERLGIRHFAVPEPTTARYRVAVDGAAWTRLIDALLEEGRRRALYLAVIAATRRGAARWAELSTNSDLARAAREQREVEVFRIAVPAPDSTQEIGLRRACVVEAWDREPDGTLRTQSRNGRTSFVASGLQQPVRIAQAGGEAETFAVLAKPHLLDIDFPIDVVYLWVDGADPEWHSRKAQVLEALGQGADAPRIEVDAVSDARFREGGELRFSMRSLELFAPWVRRVYLVTDRQVPPWLNRSHPKLHLVDHQELFGDAGALPTFNSHAIGARLHHIDGLSEHYLYLNDDVFLGREVAPQLFFQSNGVARFFLSRSSLGFSEPDAQPSHEAARRNVVDLLERDFGKTATHVFFHTPIAQRRSTMFALEKRYRAEFESTWRSQIRSATDYEINSWLHNYYGYLTGAATPGRMRYDYFALGDPTVPARLAHLEQLRDRDAFCINDTPEATPQEQTDAADWLGRYFSQPSGFET